ncbi:MAG: protein-L-isoaspartate(D-aspartate) O-methyltransferase [Nitrospinae bacterium]|nr:protein-L-isoaspartate(D-aspartate) O-methyltransferase [Nitrospinota bacterium]
MAFSLNGRREDRWRRAREDMVARQIVARGIADARVLDALREVPRHHFAPEIFRETAYADKALPIGHGQTISQPYMVAATLEALELRGGEKVLEIGAGSGYLTALLGRLAGSVRAIERVPELATRARERLDSFGLTNYMLWTADGTYGWPDEAPFDVIVSAASAPSVPAPWMQQTAPGGRIVMPLGEGEKQTLVRYRVSGSGEIPAPEELVNCVFVKLVGKYGWEKP